VFPIGLTIPSPVTTTLRRFTYAIVGYFEWALM
jgi:hypothetical protein